MVPLSNEMDRKKFKAAVITVLATVFASAIIILSSSSNGEIYAAPPSRRRLNENSFDPRTIILKNRVPHMRHEEYKSVGKGALRFDWTNLYDVEKMSPLALSIDRIQNPPDACARPLKKDLKIKRLKMPISGLGSNLHLWGRYLCNAHDNEEILMLEPPESEDGLWMWNDQRYCKVLDGQPDTFSPLACYFGHHESLRSCEFTEDEHSELMNGTAIDTHSIYENAKFEWPSFCSYVDSENNYPFNQAVHKVLVEQPLEVHASPYPFLKKHVKEQYAKIAEWNSASIEYLFQSVNPLVVNEAQRQINEIFDGSVPATLVTVHIRWGDKNSEMKLATIKEYLDACKAIIGGSWATTPQHIYVASEDPTAIEKFKSHMPRNWHAYVSGPTYRTGMTHPTSSAGESKGMDGLESMGALLVALEANRYVLTTQSNWSRLINELRMSIVDPRCGDCTEMFDVRPGEY